jgi:hypothetical protein
VKFVDCGLAGDPPGALPPAYALINVLNIIKNTEALLNSILVF